jgi:hypothetical protein
MPQGKKVRRKLARQMKNKKTKEGEHSVMQKTCGTVSFCNASFKARVHHAKSKAQTPRARLNATITHQQERRVESCWVKHKGARCRREPSGGRGAQGDV